MILTISLRAKAGVPKTLVKQKLNCLQSLYNFLKNTHTLTDSRGEFSDLHSIFILNTITFLRMRKIVIFGHVAFSSPEPPFLLVTWSAKRRALVAASIGHHTSCMCYCFSLHDSKVFIVSQCSTACSAFWPKLGL